LLQYNSGTVVGSRQGVSVRIGLWLPQASQRAESHRWPAITSPPHQVECRCSTGLRSTMDHIVPGAQTTPVPASKQTDPYYQRGRCSPMTRAAASTRVLDSKNYSSIFYYSSTR